MKYGLVENILPWDSCIIASSAMLNASEGQYGEYDERFPYMIGCRGFSKPPFLEVLMPYVKPHLEQFWGVQLIPTYVYGRVLYPGSFLNKHKDRPACEYSVTMTLGNNYPENFEYPIYMDGVPLSAPIGSGVTYKGCEALHWREPLVGNPDNFWIQAFFHFVDANGPYADHAWDKRHA